MSELQTTEAALVEYVAIAIWGDNPSDPEDDQWRFQNESTQETYRMEARAAIKAIREWDAQHGR